MVITVERPHIVTPAELLARARAGDPDAYCELAGTCEARLFKQALVLCRDPATAEELVTETLVEAWKSLHRFNETCRLSTWLYAILLHRHQKLLRKSRSRPVPLASLHPPQGEESESLLEHAPDVEPPPSEALMRKELSDQLSQAIDSLPARFQQVIRLRFYEGASLAEITAALGLPLGTVKSRLHYALEQLRGKRILLNLFNTSKDTSI